jgi:uridine kinase
MGKKKLINVVGAPGSGCSTIGRLVAEKRGMCFLDSDDFYWERLTPPSNVKRAESSRNQAFLSAVAQADRSVLVAGSVEGWGDGIDELFDIVFFLELPDSIRVPRIEVRETARFGSVDKGFLAWASSYETGGRPGRSRRRHESWLADISAEIYRVDNSGGIETALTQLVSLLGGKR